MSARFATPTVARALVAALWVALANPALANPAQLPDYAARRLGETTTLDLGTLEGRAVMINTWATWCGPCRAEMPGIEALHQRYQSRGLTIVGVNIDEGQVDGAVSDYVRQLQMTFPVLRDPANRFAKKFRVMGVPETLLFDRAGKLVKRWRGKFETESAETQALIEKALGKPTGAVSGKASADAGAPQAPAGVDSTIAAARLDPVARGRRLAQQRGCVACHASDASKGDGPGWGGLAGTTATLADGRSVRRDALYLARAISQPDADLVAGYPAGLMAAAMPGKLLKPDEIDALVRYIESLGTAGVQP